MRLAKTAMSSLYKQLMSAMGRKLAGSVVDSFLCIRMVVAFFHDAGTSLAEKQCLNSRARMRHLGSSRRRWRYSIRSLPGAEFDMVRSFEASSSGLGGSNRVLSTLAEGTWALSSAWRESVLQERGPNALEKKVVASSVVPSKPGLSSPKIFWAARFFEIR